MSNLTILFLSCGRIKYLEQTLDSIKKHFQTLEANINPAFHCFDNGSPLPQQRKMLNMEFDQLVLSTKNLGMGPAINQLISSVRTPYILNMENDWVLENLKGVLFFKECAAILENDPNIIQVKLDIHHFTDFQDRRIYDGPFRSDKSSISYFVQNPNMTFGGFCFPPAVTRTDALLKLGPFIEEQPFRRCWAESEFSARSAQHYVAVKSPEMLLFRHIGEQPSKGWGAGV